MLLRCSSLLSMRCSRISLGSGLSHISMASWCTRPLWKNTYVMSGPSSPDFSRITSTSSLRSRRSSEPTPTSLHQQTVPQPRSTCPFSSASKCYNGFMRLPAPVTRGSSGRLNSLYAGSGGHLLRQMWRGLSGHALLAPGLGSVASSQRDCWNPYLLHNAPGPTCLWTFSPTYPTREDSPR
ncbi:hypothetical protein QTP70_013866 [Hemibagrus guttatus]|uniref:Uncharacterized protein n=1 Tax=Hemibagrus guttatus TaxID=175788 RepID=A0AAE0RDW5_9TELE|nr:hypothetical protein QTP70_013866 [Hemibagrus guttatus]